MVAGRRAGRRGDTERGKRAGDADLPQLRRGRWPAILAALAEIDASGAFDAMVFDFDLPGMDGSELAALLRQRGTGTPIIALTASAHGDEEQRAKAAGMGAFLRKPVLPEDIRATLARALQRVT